MDEVAHRTLRLRAFLRKFRAFPDEYYEYVNGLLPSEPDWATLYPEEWEESGRETPRVELGTDEATKLLRKRVRAIRREHGTRTVLLGGPPCQSYSVAGRARNAGNPNYDINEDKRLSLYKEYAMVLGKLQPWIAVMENVKGMLSAEYEGARVFDDVMEALQNAGGRNRYRLLALAPATGCRSWKDGLRPKDYLVRAEEHGVPQRRHRVFVICIRTDVAATLPEGMFPKLKPREEQVVLSDVVGEMQRDIATSPQQPPSPTLLGTASQSASLPPSVASFQSCPLDLSTLYYVPIHQHTRQLQTPVPLFPLFVASSRHLQVTPTSRTDGAAVRLPLTDARTTVTNLLNTLAVVTGLTVRTRAGGLDSLNAVTPARILLDVGSEHARRLRP